ncbi:LysR substrate-binding domain-containing protein [Acidimangrovimonas sediminis]|uniref:LysR substrate-binding domain-containing protein n=1 Tax=Acidimangrovimonas sediminis TaxID=2056283 RepID=UPI0018EC387C|nr:LysR substrate-binding domain-containing protein [Acidimangrovimonas sediminis]
MASMNVRQLEAFHAVMETGSVTLAAERLGVSQPAVSKLLKSFSETCGFKLFTRSGGRMLPTADARLLATEVERLFSGTERIQKLARAVRDREWGEVSVAAPPALSARFLAHALSPFMKSQRKMHVSLSSYSSPRVAELVASQQIDIGLTVQPFDHADVTSESLMRFAMVCALPAAHPLAQRKVIRIDDLRGEPFVGLQRDDCSIMTIDRAFQLRGVEKRSVVQVPMSETACDFVAGGAGVSIVPSFVGLGYSTDQLVKRPLLPLTTMTLWMLIPASRPPSLAAQKVADVIRAATRAHGIDPSIMTTSVEIA